MYVHCTNEGQCTIIGFARINTWDTKHAFPNSDVTCFKDMLWITGGWNGQQRSLISTEFIGSNGVRQIGPDLPMRLYGHCVVKLSAYQIMIIGMSLFINIWDDFTEVVQEELEPDRLKSNDTCRGQPIHLSVAKAELQYIVLLTTNQMGPTSASTTLFSFQTNDTTITFLGGVGNPTGTLLYNFNKKSWETGPNLKVGRWKHSCGIIEDILIEGRRTVIAIGGNDYPDTLNSVELFVVESER